MNEIKYVTTLSRHGPIDGAYTQPFDDIVKIDMNPNSPNVGGYIVYFTYGSVGGRWSVGHPDSYVDYEGVRYSGEEVEKLRNLLERKEIEHALDRLAGAGDGEAAI